MNFRVIVEPRRSMWNSSEKWELQTCKDIIEQIKRHVDDVGY